MKKDYELKIYQKDGTFPTFSTGVNQFTMAVNGTHTYDIVAVKTLKYL